MTEPEWLASDDPEPMLAFLRGRASARQLRLFAVACSRRVWLVLDNPGRAAVEAAERFADGLIGPEALRAARLACRAAGGQASWYAAATDPFIAAGNASRSARAAAEGAAQAALLRDIVGNPFRSVTIAPAWVTPQVARLVQLIHDGRAFARLPELADALEAAGCRSDEILVHCRSAGEHVHGCWVIDALMRRD